MTYLGIDLGTSGLRALLTDETHWSFRLAREDRVFWINWPTRR